MIFAPFTSRLGLRIAILCAIILYGLPAAAQERDKFGRYLSTPDTGFIWHPEKILVVWPDMKLSLYLPYEEERSGVANLLLRESGSGEVHLLDSLSDNHKYGKKRFFQGEFPIDSATHLRHYSRFNPGAYDAILLYNNGKHVIYKNREFQKDTEMTIDMRLLPILPPDEDSRQWLAMRKFTDVIGERTLNKNYTGDSEEKILGYIFGPGGRADEGTSISIREDRLFYKEGRIIHKNAVSSRDGYFEIDIDGEDLSRILEIWTGGCDIVHMEIKPNLGLFIVMELEYNIDEIPKNLKSAPLVIP